MLVVDIAGYGPPRTTVHDEVTEAAENLIVRISSLPFDHPDAIWVLLDGTWYRYGDVRGPHRELDEFTTRQNGAQWELIASLGQVYQRRVSGANGWVRLDTGFVQLAEQPGPTVTGGERPGTIYRDSREDSALWTLDDDEWVTVGAGGGGGTPDAAFTYLFPEQGFAFVQQSGLTATFGGQMAVTMHQPDPDESWIRAATIAASIDVKSATGGDPDSQPWIDVRELLLAAQDENSAIDDWYAFWLGQPIGLVTGRISGVDFVGQAINGYLHDSDGAPIRAQVQTNDEFNFEWTVQVQND